VKFYFLKEGVRKLFLLAGFIILLAGVGKIHFKAILISQIITPVYL
jgi:hypothetical protein